MLTFLLIAWTSYALSLVIFSTLSSMSSRLKIKEGKRAYRENMRAMDVQKKNPGANYIVWSEYGDFDPYPVFNRSKTEEGPGK